MTYHELTKALSCIALCTGLFAAFAVHAEELSFTLEQADLGKSIYQDNCQMCHGTKLSNGQFGTPLKGSYFRRKWAGSSLAALLIFTRESMPPENKGSLPAESYAAAVAYILSQNKIAPGQSEIAAAPEDSIAISLPW